MGSLIDGHWLPSHHADPRAIALYLRHYSARHYRDHRRRTQFCPPGEKMVLLTEDCSALFVWHRPVMERLSGEEGICCTIFRNEGPVLSSELVRESRRAGLAALAGATPLHLRRRRQSAQEA